MTHGMTPGGALPGAPGYAPPGAPPGGPKPRRRMLLIGVPVIVVLAIIGLVAGLAAGGSSGPGLPVPLVKINAKSQAAALTGYTYVQYNSGAASNAQIYGVIRHARKGEVAQLYAQQFPYHQAPVQVTSVILHPTQGRASYQFQVTPILATHYVVKIIQDKTSSTVLGSSPVTTVYVIAGGNSGSNPTCARPVCHLSFATTTFVPPPALATEMAKRWYTYFAITFSPSKEPPAPATLALGAGSPQLSGEKQVGDNEYTETVTFTTTVGNNGYTWAWLACTKDTESADGVGLPGSHGCGNPTAPRTGPYIG
jgi:hypothetical protein